MVIGNYRQESTIMAQYDDGRKGRKCFRLDLYEAAIDWVIGKPTKRFRFPLSLTTELQKWLPEMVRAYTVAMDGGGYELHVVSDRGEDVAIGRITVPIVYPLGVERVEELPFLLVAEESMGVGDGDMGRALDMDVRGKGGVKTYKIRFISRDYEFWRDAAMSLKLTMSELYLTGDGRRIKIERIECAEIAVDERHSIEIHRSNSPRLVEKSKRLWIGKMEQVFGEGWKLRLKKGDKVVFVCLVLRDILIDGF